MVKIDGKIDGKINGKKDGKRLKQKRNDDLITMAFILF